GRATALSQAQAISGLGGIGKTQTAVEYAYRHRQDYQAVLWARAENREVLRTDLVSLARVLDLPGKDEQDQDSIVAAVKRWLNTDAPLEATSPDIIQQARDISHLLAGLPLALDQAGAYIEETGCSPGDYLERYQTRRASLLSRRGQQGKEHPESVHTTVSLSF